MKKIINCFFAIITIFSFSIISCDNTLNLVEPGGNVPIVYGLISSSDSTQYIRVEKGFIDPFIPAQQIAQIEDSLYYGDEVSVKLINLSSNNSFELQKVNASDIGKSRDEGFFPTDPNYIYIHYGGPNDFSQGDSVKFELDRGDESEVVYSKIKLLNNLLVTKPQADQTISIPDLADFTIKWIVPNTDTEDLPSSYSINLYINYEEANTDDEDPEFVPKVLKWEFADIEDETEASQEGKEFFKYLQSELVAAPNFVRTFEWLDVEIIYTGQEVKKYKDFLNANTGITSSQPIPPYSNLSEGLGLLGERNVHREDRIFLKPTTLDSLSNGRYTKDLGFL